jgi:hypothetical protein
MVMVNWDPRVNVSPVKASVAQAGMTMAIQQVIKKNVIKEEYFCTISRPHVP